jgi:lambda repressor-like predicted transcriptional regulator
MSAATLENHDVLLKMSALQAALPIVLALEECNEELRKESLNLFKQMGSGKLDENERFATTTLLAEILFPNADHKGLPGLDLVEAEEIARKIEPEAVEALDGTDRDERVFAERLRDAMSSKGLTQTQLAEIIGVGQPAVSMMLQRICRPQKRTSRKLAEALQVAPGELWPGFKES